MIDQELKLLYHNLNFFFRNPTPTESPVEKVESWPLWEDLDKHYLEIDEFPTLRLIQLSVFFLACDWSIDQKSSALIG